MFVATMDTEHYHWTAAGDTEESASYALVSGFLRSLEAHGRPWDVEANGSPEDCYGVRIMEVHPGQCFQDEWEV